MCRPLSFRSVIVYHQDVRSETLVTDDDRGTDAGSRVAANISWHMLLEEPSHGSRPALHGGSQGGV